MSDLRTAAQQALEALDKLYLPGELERVNAAITALRAALAQQDEPLNLRDPAVQKRLATQWGYVPAAQAEPVEQVATLIARRDALLEALRALVRNEGLDVYSHLDKGIGTATAAGQRWLKARAAIKAVEETNAAAIRARNNT